MSVLSTIRRWAFDSRPSLLTKAAAEFTGCMIFHFLGSVSPTASTNAVALMVLVYYTAKLSGAHLNPALTMTFALLGYTNPVEVLVYWIAQVSGCIFGAMWISALVPGLSIGAPTYSKAQIAMNYPYHDVSGCFQAEDGLSLAQTFGWEAVGTFCFILPIFSVVWYTQSKSGYGNTGPIIVGLSLYASASAVGQFTGGALNPARAVASAIVFKCPKGDLIWSYVAGEFVGAMVVPIAVIPWYGVSATVGESKEEYDGDASDGIEISPPSKYVPTEEEIAVATDILNAAMIRQNVKTSDDNTGNVVVEMDRWSPPLESKDKHAPQSHARRRSPPGTQDEPLNVYQCKPVKTRILNGILLNGKGITKQSSFSSVVKSPKHQSPSNKSMVSTASPDFERCTVISGIMARRSQLSSPSEKYFSPPHSAMCISPPHSAMQTSPHTSDKASDKDFMASSPESIGIDVQAEYSLRVN